MSVNLLEMVQQNLGYSELQKIDPNTQVMVADENSPGEDKFSQAAIPSVLIALCEFAQTDEGAADILQSNTATNWMNKIFDNNRKEAVQTIAAYAKQSDEDPVAKMNAIATEAVKIAMETMPAGATVKDVKTFFNNQKSTILLFLPASLNMGELLHNNVLDDRTNKMEGPVSSLIQNIGDAFSNPVTGEENQELQTSPGKKAEQNY
jgi:hypothetical protein